MTTSDKQIEEIANDLRVLDCLQHNPNYSIEYQRAVGLHSLGYRKVSEILAEIEHTVRAAVILLKFEKDEEIRNTKTECYTDFIGYLAELEKKYMEDTE